MKPRHIIYRFEALEMKNRTGKTVPKNNHFEQSYDSKKFSFFCELSQNGFRAISPEPGLGPK